MTLILESVPNLHRSCAGKKEKTEIILGDAEFEPCIRCTTYGSFFPSSHQTTPLSWPAWLKVKTTPRGA